MQIQIKWEGKKSKEKYGKAKFIFFHEKNDIIRKITLYKTLERVSMIPSEE